MKIFNFIKLIHLHEKATILNNFIDEVCYRDLNTLNKIQRKAVIALAKARYELGHLCRCLPLY